jgi:hypothetical protein
LFKTRLLRPLTLDRFLAICLLLAVGGAAFSFLISRVAWSPLMILSATASALVMIYLAFLISNLQRRLYKRFLSGRSFSKHEWAEMIYPEVEDVIVEEDHVAWRLNQGGVAAAKILAVTEVPYTMSELSTEELERRLKAYSTLMSTEDCMIATYQMRLPIDKKSYVDLIRRERDRYKLSYEVGGPQSHLDQAERFTAALKRIEARLREDPYDTRFFILVLTKADKPEELRPKFTDVLPSIKTRFEKDIGVMVKELKHEELLDALRFFPPFPSLASVKSSNVRPVTTLSLDLAWQNPLVVRRMPSLEKIAKGVLIGFTPDKIPVTWDPYSVGNPHAVILGPTRSGKTTLLKSFAARAMDLYNIPLWIFDPSGEYVKYVRSRGGIVIDFRKPTSKVNPLILCGVDPESRITAVLRMLTYLVDLTGPERGLFREETLEAYKSAGIDPVDKSTWSDVLSSRVTLKRVYERLLAKYERGDVKPEDRPFVRSLVKDKLPALATGAYGFMSEGDVDIGRLVEDGKSVCFLLKGVPDLFSRAITWTIMELLNDYMNVHRLYDKIRLIVIIDEAHRYCATKQGLWEDSYPPLVRFVKEAGKFGFCEFCATQDSWDLPDAFFNNVGTLVLFGSSDEATLKFYRERVGLSEADVERMKWFDRGDCFIKFYADPRPIQVHVVPEHV